MLVPLRRLISRVRGQEHGSIAVEAAIIFPVFLILVFGIIDFGHAWYMKQTITNASREGARYGTRYWIAGETRVLPSALNPSISSYILNKSADNGGKGGVGLVSLLPSDANPTVPTPTGTGYTIVTPPGNPLSVTVTATKNWWVVNKFIPGMESSLTMSSTTCMAVE
jgi:Flp pilus assembly protein TadG